MEGAEAFKYIYNTLQINCKISIIRTKQCEYLNQTSYFTDEEMEIQRTEISGETGGGIETKSRGLGPVHFLMPAQLCI